MRFSSWPLVALSFAPHLASAISPPARWGTGCAYALQRIYCFGGSTWSFQAGVDASRTMNDLFFLDVAESFTISSSGSAWIGANNTGSLEAEHNFMFAITSIPENNTLYINGGVGSMNNSLLVNPSIAYNAKTETWTAVSGNSGLQTYIHSMSVGSDNKVYVWGGVSDSGNGYISVDYPRNMRILDYNSNQWSTVMLPNSFAARIYHISVMGNDQRTIYFLGGITEQQYTNENGTTSFEEADALFSDILTFNTETSLWATRETAGDYIPTPRVLHAAALKPNTNEIVIYGGAHTNISLGVVPDFCAVLDTTSMQWTNVNLSQSAGAGARFGHAAVFPEDSSLLFVMFGIDSNVYERTDFQVLDTDDWQWVDSYVGPGRKDDGSSGDPEHPDNAGGSGEGGVSGGTIAGAVVGAVAGVGIIAGALFFFLRRRRRNQGEQNSREKGDDSQRPAFLVDVSDHGPGSPPPRYDDQTAPAMFHQEHYSALTPSQTGAEHQRSSSYSSTVEPTSETGLSGSTSEAMLTEGRRSFGVEAGKPDASDATPRMTLQPVKPDGAGSS
ncbi:hypothetical protein BDB00DRAFT_832893 [Zychaea mexicana]|uniref:uncharacterized protein n=1 Tax=Zychaea mexicana TaxID=64656 RepID=UPI0022FF2E0D|nr:uncharacterized protein BDB00DRAFT_832893 [Zychaea mexicana]KAI9491416.1 hypothetical protein BDB00DRAFT_832893 [Zychaea mexicana]